MLQFIICEKTQARLNKGIFCKSCFESESNRDVTANEYFVKDEFINSDYISDDDGSFDEHIIKHLKNDLLLTRLKR